MNFDDPIFLHRPKLLDDAKFFSIGTIDDDDKKLVVGPKVISLYSWTSISVDGPKVFSGASIFDGLVHEVYVHL